MYTDWLLEEIERKWSEKEFMIWHGDVKCYSWLKKEILYWKGYLQRNSINSGQIVSLEGDYSPAIVALFLALMWNKNIIVPIANVTFKEMKRRHEIANVMVRFIFEKNKLKLKEQVLNKKIKNELLEMFIDKNEPGLILFSSGSTGSSKGILHNLNILTEKFYESKKSFKSLIFLLFDHIGGINTLFSIISSGGTLVVTSSRQPEDILNYIEKYKIELLPTSPTFLNLILMSEVYEHYDCSSLKLITYGTESMPESLLKRLKNIFPDVRFKQTYGISEVGILGTKSESSESVWMKIGGKGYQIKVVDEILWIKTKISMIGYLNAPSPFTEDGWFITGDKVEVKSEYLKIVGRDTDIINVGGEKVSPLEVENVILQMDNVEYVTVYGEKNFITGQMVVAEVNLSSDESLMSLKKRIHEFCKDKLGKYKIPAKIKITDSQLYNERFKKVRVK